MCTSIVYFIQGDQTASDNHPTIVLHIGSSTLTLGFATDPIPRSLPHIIAYRGCTQSDSNHTSLSGGASNNDKSKNDFDQNKSCNQNKEERTRDETLVLDCPLEIAVSRQENLCFEKKF